MRVSRTFWSSRAKSAPVNLWFPLIPPQALTAVSISAQCSAPLPSTAQQSSPEERFPADQAEISFAGFHHVVN